MTTLGQLHIPKGVLVDAHAAYWDADDVKGQACYRKAQSKGLLVPFAHEVAQQLVVQPALQVQEGSQHQSLPHPSDAPTDLRRHEVKACHSLYPDKDLIALLCRNNRKDRKNMSGFVTVRFARQGTKEEQEEDSACTASPLARP